MAKGGARKNAGRKSRAFEMDIARIISNRMPHILDKSANAVDDFFDDPNIPKEAKAELGRGFLLKAMPQNIELKKTEEVYHAIDIRLEELTASDLKNLIQISRGEALPERAA